MTNEHVITKDMVENQESLILYFNNEKKEKKLNQTKMKDISEISEI